MGIFSDVFLASDFDNTLTGPDGVIPSENLRAIRDFIAEGGIFTVNSGRSIPMFRRKAALVPTNAPCLLYNGAARYDYATETLLRAEYLPDIGEVLRQLPEPEGAVRIELQSRTMHYVVGRDAQRDAYLTESGVPFTYISLDALPQEPFLKAGIYGIIRKQRYEKHSQVDAAEIARFDALEEFLCKNSGGRYNVNHSMPRILEVYSSQCSKGLAARALAREMGRGTLVCIGDAPNDLPMLEEADYAFCPADCDPALRNYAKVAPSAEGSVASAIEQLRLILSDKR